MVKSGKSKEQPTNAELHEEQNELHEAETISETVNAGDSQNTVSEESANETTQKYNELNDKYLRLYSDFDNYRKRVIKEKVELSKTASEDVISGLLSVLDDFERAIGAMGENDEDPVKHGIILIFNKFKSTLMQKGLAETESMGKEFDTDFHEAIANIPAPSEELKSKILDVTQKGYTLNGKVIRFAKVVVGI
jgi:molecular chaperone GrpE